MCLPLNKQKNFKNEMLNIEEENQMISRVILKIHGDFYKRLNTYKITHIFEHDYGIKISFEEYID